MNAQTATRQQTQQRAQTPVSQGSVVPLATRLPYPRDSAQEFGVDHGAWKVLVEAIFPAAKSPEAVLMALRYCRARNLDIFKRPVNIVPMWSSAQKKEVETVWPGINEVQTTAARTGGWAGMDPPRWGPDRTETLTGQRKVDGAWETASVTLTFPEWCEVTVYRMIAGQRCPFTETVYWQEAYSRAGGKNSALPTDMWAKRPRGQLHKCAKAASLRAAFPEEIGNDYTADEMEGQVLLDAPAPAAPSLPRQPDPSKLLAAPTATAPDGTQYNAETGEITDDPPADDGPQDDTLSPWWCELQENEKGPLWKGWIATLLTAIGETKTHHDLIELQAANAGTLNMLRQVNGKGQAEYDKILTAIGTRRSSIGALPELVSTGESNTVLGAG